MTQEIIDAVREIEREKGIESGTLIDALQDGLLAAYKKTPGAARHAVVELDDAGDFRVYAVQLPADIEERLLDEARERALEELERLEQENGERSHVLLNDDDLEIDWSDVPEEQVQFEDVTPHDFGRIAAQTAKQVIQQRIREAERAMMYDEYIDRVSEVVTGIVQQAGDRNNVLVDLGKVEALLPRSEQVDGERYEQGSRIKAVITEVRSGTKGPQVILSRRDPELIKTLFELEVPEIADGLVEIRGVAREPGYRSKIAVESHAQGVDPVGACVGPRGSRVRMVVSELRGEKIDIIPWNDEPARFLAKALSPARVREVLLDDDAREATVIVPDDQLALAIGKEGLERPPGLAPHRLEDRHHLRHGVRAAGGRRGLRRRGRRGRGLLRPLRRDPLQRQALPERGAARDPLLRRSRRTRRSPAPRPSVPADGARRSRDGHAPRRPSSSSRWPRSRSRSRREASRSRPRPWRATAIRRDARAGQDVRRLRAEGAAAGAPALRRAGGRPDAVAARRRPRRLHLPAALVLRARAGAAGVRAHAAPDGARRSGTRGPLHWSTD